MMNSVSDVLLQKFFANIGARADALQAAQPALGVVAAAPASAEVFALKTPDAAPVEETKLNALSLIWAVIKDFFGNLFHRSKAT